AAGGRAAAAREGRLLRPETEAIGVPFPALDTLLKHLACRNCRVGQARARDRWAVASRTTRAQSLAKSELFSGERRPTGASPCSSHPTALSLNRGEIR